MCCQEAIDCSLLCNHSADQAQGFAQPPHSCWYYCDPKDGLDAGCLRGIISKPAFSLLTLMSSPTALLSWLGFCSAAEKGIWTTVIWVPWAMAFIYWLAQAWDSVVALPSLPTPVFAYLHGVWFASHPLKGDFAGLVRLWKDCGTLLA